MVINSLLYFNVSTVQALSARTLFRELERSFFPKETDNSYIRRGNNIDDRSVVRDRNERGEATNNLRGGEDHTTDRAVPPQEGQSSICTDVIDWYDSDGPTYNCEWYGESMTAERCRDYGNTNGNFGYTASRACCACGGGIYYNVPSVFTESQEEKEDDDDSSYCAKIQVQATNEFLHLDGLGDQLLSTRYPNADDDFTRFIFERQVNEASYRIRVKAGGMYLQEDGSGDKILSTRTTHDSRSFQEENENFTKFFLEFQENDGTYKIRVKANGRYWYDDSEDSKIVSTVSRVPQGNEDNVKFRLEKC